jgi:hypothetical protein
MEKSEYVENENIQKRIAELLVDSDEITIQDDRGGSGMWFVTYQTSFELLEERMVELWGERSNEFDSTSIASHAWKHFDETGEVAQ